MDKTVPAGAAILLDFIRLIEVVRKHWQLPKEKPQHRGGGKLGLRPLMMCSAAAH